MNLKELQSRLLELMAKQSKYFFGTPDWIQLESEIDEVNEEINKQLLTQE